MDNDGIVFEEVFKNDAMPTAIVKEGQERRRSVVISTSNRKPVPGRYRNSFEELKVKCNPARFMSPYDPQKVSVANLLYSQILICKEDKIALKALRLRAIKELGIKISTERLYNELIIVCNPKQYTGSAWNKELLDLANKKYTSILHHADDILALEAIRKEVEPLYKNYIRQKEEQKDEKRKERDREAKLIIILLIISILLFLTFNY